MSADVLISKLDGVRKCQLGQWWARCPSHEDKSPSLSVKEGDNGVVLLHCFAGCKPGEVLSAVGLEFGDLYPEKLESRKGQKPYWNARNLLVVIKDEAIVVACAAGRITKGEALSKDDLDRVGKAVKRILDALEVANVR